MQRLETQSQRSLANNDLIISSWKVQKQGKLQDMFVDSIALEAIEDSSFFYSSFLNYGNLRQLVLKSQAKQSSDQTVLIQSRFLDSHLQTKLAYSFINLPKATRNCEHTPIFYNLTTICRNIVVSVGYWPGNNAEHTAAQPTSQPSSQTGIMKTSLLKVLLFPYK